MSSDRINISVETKVYNKDGSLFVDLGTMYWPLVDQEVRDWFTGSCKTTAFWLLGLPEATGKSYTLKYRTIVTNPFGEVLSDTTLLEFERMTYEQVVQFEYWALDQLKELLELFQKKNNKVNEQTKKRSKIKTIWNIAKQIRRNRN